MHPPTPDLPPGHIYPGEASRNSSNSICIFSKIDSCQHIIFEAFTPISLVADSPQCGFQGIYNISRRLNPGDIQFVNPRFAAMMQEKINMKVDTSEIEQEIAALEKQLKQSYAIKRNTLEEIECLDPDDRHYKRRKADLDDRLYRMYDKIDEQEQMLIEARAKKRSIEADKVTGDNIYKILIYFDRLYDLMSEEERRKLMEALIQEIQIYPERQPNGQWLKSITFRLPIIDGEMKIPVNDGLDKNVHVEVVCQLSNHRKRSDSYVKLEVEAEDYYRIKDSEKSE